MVFLSLTNKNLDNLCIIGIKSRGDILSERIVNKINKLTKSSVKNGYIDVTFYRDDFLKSFLDSGLLINNNNY